MDEREQDNLLFLDRELSSLNVPPRCARKMRDWLHCIYRVNGLTFALATLRGWRQTEEGEFFNVP
jgi:hypothetical protein